MRRPGGAPPSSGEDRGPGYEYGITGVAEGEGGRAEDELPYDVDITENGWLKSMPTSGSGTFGQNTDTLKSVANRIGSEIERSSFSAVRFSRGESDAEPEELPRGTSKGKEPARHKVWSPFQRVSVR